MPAMLCVYALVPAGAERAAARGPGGTRLRLVRGGAVAAVVADTARRTRATEGHLRAYDRTIQALIRRLPAVVPVRFGTYVDDDTAVVAILRARQAVLTRTLAHVRHRAQMTLRLAVAPQAVVQADARASGTQYLRARAGEQRVMELEALRPALRRWIRDERVERRGRVASVYHLVPRGSVDAYRAAVTKAAAQHQVRLIASGPWPAYAFAVPW